MPTATDFQQSASGKIFKAHQLGHPGRVVLIACPFDRVEKLTRAKLTFTIAFCATRILTPLIARSLLFLASEYFVILSFHLLLHS